MLFFGFIIFSKGREVFVWRAVQDEQLRWLQRVKAVIVLVFESQRTQAGWSREASDRFYNVF